MFGTVFDLLARGVLLHSGRNAQHASLYATRTQAPPVSLRQAQYKCIFDGIMRLQGVAKAAENPFVFIRVFLGQDHENRRCQAMP
jgi:hypothetical protein